MKLIFLVFTLFTATVFANVESKKGQTAPKIIQDKSAFINVCPAMMAGCVNKISVHGKTYIISVDTAANKGGGLTELVKRIVNSTKASGMGSSLPFTVEGYLAKESGHMPNPTVMFEVFKITYIAGVR